MNARACCVPILLSAAMLLGWASRVDAGIAADLGIMLDRYFRIGPTYGYNHHYGYLDCQLPWQPITSVMHPNVLPPGMHRPPPLRRPRPWLAPPSPYWREMLPAGGGPVHAH